MHNVFVNRLSQACQGKSVVRWSDCLAITIAIDWDVKLQTKQISSFENSVDFSQRALIGACALKRITFFKFLYLFLVLNNAYLQGSYREVD